MTTPVTGIGRNLLASMLVRAFRGNVAAGISLPDILDGGFSGRLSRKFLAIVDEAKEGSGERRWARGERMKSLITEEHRVIKPKYGHQSVERNCCRWLMFSNHKDAIPFDSNDRRIVVIANPTERRSPGYYERQFARLDDQAFIASIRRYLETLDLSTFKAGEHAPMSEAKLETLNAMASEVDRLVAAFKDECETELTSRTLIKDSIAFEDHELKVDANHLTHAIERAGMVNTGRSIKAGGKRHAVIIIRGAWGAADVRNADSMALAKIVFPPDGVPPEGRM